MGTTGGNRIEKPHTKGSRLIGDIVTVLEGDTNGQG